jgi:N-methylhydantoinase A/oxoprolinase/acetone carboxylase beta subunit
MADAIKFEFDQPVEVALKFTEPKLVASQFGDDRAMYSLTDERVMFVDQLTAARIRSLGVQPGEMFMICKTKNGRLTEYQVYRESDEPQSAAPARNGVVAFGGHKKSFPALKPTLPERLYHAPEDTTLEDQLRASIDMVERKKLERALDQHPAPAPAAIEMPWARLLVNQTNALVDAYAAVLSAASAKHGNAVKPEDVKSLLITTFINLANGKGKSNAA